MQLIRTSARRMIERVPPTLRGMALMLVVTFSFSAQLALVKMVSVDLHPFEIGFFRQFFGLVVFLPVFLRRGPGILRTRNLGLFSLRAVLETTSMLMFFTAIAITPLAKATALHYTAPLFATALAVIVLGESIRLRRVLGLVFGFTGALVVVRPGTFGVDIGAALTVGSAALWGGTMIIIKVLGRTESSVRITIYNALLSTPLALLAALPFWSVPTLDQLGLMALAGAMGSLAHLSLAQAFKEADVTAVLPVDFMRLVWAAVFGFILFAEVPEAWTWLGGAMVFSAVVYIAYREKQALDHEGAGDERPRPTPDAPRGGR